MAVGMAQDAQGSGHGPELPEFMERLGNALRHRDWTEVGLSDPYGHLLTGHILWSYDLKSHISPFNSYVSIWLFWEIFNRTEEQGHLPLWHICLYLSYEGLLLLLFLFWWLEASGHCKYNLIHHSACNSALRCMQISVLSSK